MIHVLLVVMATWLGAAALLTVPAGKALGGARRLSDRHERPRDLQRVPAFCGHLANRTTPATAFGTAVTRLAL